MEHGIRSVMLLGVRVDGPTMDQAVSMLLQMATEPSPHQVATVNPEFVMIARANPAFRRVLLECALTLPDGMGLLWAARALGSRLPERLAGVDVMVRLAGEAGRRGIPVFLLGAARGVAEEAAAALRRRFPHLQVAGTYAGSPDPADEEEICRRIEGARPGILFVAYGAPAQDLWIARIQPRLRIPLAMGVGGSFDFLSGRVPRAPRWMQDNGLEWCYRLAREPWRWRRQMRLPHFALLVTAQRIAPRRAAGEEE